MLYTADSDRSALVKETILTFGRHVRVVYGRETLTFLDWIFFRKSDWIGRYQASLSCLSCARVQPRTRGVATSKSTVSMNSATGDILDIGTLAS